MKINLRDVQSTFEPLEQGEYSATVTKVGYVETPKSNPEGYPYFKVEFTVDDSAKKVWRNLSLAPKALIYLKEALAHMGADASMLEDEEVDADDIMSAMMGAQVRIAVSLREYNKKWVNDVDEILEPSFFS